MDDASVIDEMKIWRLISAWGYARDNSEWDMLAHCFCQDATVNISWINAPASEFVARSKEMAAKRKPGTHLKHVFASPLVRIEVKRAFSICHVNLESRDEIDGHAVDLRVWFRFFDLLRKEEDGKWRIHNRTAVYEKDRIDPVDPRGVPAALFANMDLSGFVPATRYLSWYVARMGFKPRTDMVTVYSQEEQTLKRRSDVWLRGEAV